MMVDIETFGQTPGSIITSIGAVFFDENQSYPEAAFYQRVCPKSCVEAGLKFDPETVQWWLGQNDAARSEMSSKDRMPLRECLELFTQFCQQAPKQKLCVWGNGASFDNTLIPCAFRALGMETPWLFYNDRCYRTMKNMFSKVPMQKRLGTHHNALDDAVSQADHLIDILKSIRG